MKLPPALRIRFANSIPYRSPAAAVVQASLHNILYHDIRPTLLSDKLELTIASTSTRKMSGISSTTFSNTDTGSKPADPYKQHNKTDNEDISLKQKVEDLLEFVEDVKYGMLTTHQTDTGMLVSRCMAIAARVSAPEIQIC